MEPLDPELRRLVEDGLREALPSPAVTERVLGRILERLPGGPGGGDEGPPDGDGGGGSPGPGDGAIDPSAPTGLAGAAKASALSSTLKSILVVGLITGGAAAVSKAIDDPGRARGPAIEAATTPRSGAPGGAPRAADEPVPEDSFVTDLEPTPGETLEEPPGDATTRPPGRRPARASATKTTSAPPPAPTLDPLVDESRRLAEAEAALARGDHRRARELAGALARDLPRGQLALEREAIDLCARCGLAEPGAGDAARAFLAAHPGAPVAAKIEARCAEAIAAKSSRL